MRHELKDKLHIRELNTAEELGMLKDLEKVIWSDDDPIPVHQSMTVVKNGGLAIGAFIDEKLIGFQFSFPGYDGGKVYLCSHNLGIHPDYRRSGIGEMIKLKQREKATALGYDLVVWTYDPLETVNGYLNLTKLGGACTQYIENCYGELPDALNAGLPSDRFLVEWRMDNNTAADQETADHNYPELIDIAYDGQGFPHPNKPKLHQEERLLYVPVPNNFQQIKTYSLELALEWRMATRTVFSNYLEKGWQVTALRKSNNDMLYHYVLKK